MSIWAYLIAGLAMFGASLLGLRWLARRDEGGPR